MNTGRLWLKGNATTAVTETIATVTLTADDQYDPVRHPRQHQHPDGHQRHRCPLRAPAARSCDSWRARPACSPSSATGNTIALTASPTLVNNIIPRGVVISPTGLADLATYSGGSVVAYSSYVTTIAAAVAAAPNANLLLDGSGALPVGLLTANLQVNALVIRNAHALLQRQLRAHRGQWQRRRDRQQRQQRKLARRAHHRHAHPGMPDRLRRRLEISGVIQSTGGAAGTYNINKAGPGDLRLSGANTYVGITSVEQAPSPPARSPTRPRCSGSSSRRARPPAASPSP